MSEAKPRWKNRPEGSNWGDFGPDDQLGRLNLITAEQVLSGAREIREGMSFCLSMPLDFPGESLLNQRRHPPIKKPTEKDGLPYLNFPVANLDPGAIDILSDDSVLLYLQYSTHWDSFAHVGARFDADDDGVDEAVYYNGYRAHEHIQGPVEYRTDGAETGLWKPYVCGCNQSHAAALGIENAAVKGIQGRGLLIDLVAHFGYEYRTIGYEDLMRVIAVDEIEIAEGDIVLIRTGFTELILEMDRHPNLDALNARCSALDGRDDRLLQWLTDTRIAALVADNYAVERFPALPAKRVGPAPALPLHHHCLFKLGMPLGELWYLRDLAEWLRSRGRSHFMLTAPPLRLPGAIGSPVTPIATV